MEAMMSSFSARPNYSFENFVCPPRPAVASNINQQDSSTEQFKARFVIPSRQATTPLPSLVQSDSLLHLDSVSSVVHPGPKSMSSHSVSKTGDVLPAADESDSDFSDIVRTRRKRPCSILTLDEMAGTELEETVPLTPNVANEESKLPHYSPQSPLPLPLPTRRDLAFQADELPQANQPGKRRRRRSTACQPMRKRKPAAALTPKAGTHSKRRAPTQKPTWYVDSIVGRKREQSQVFFLVRWENTWEPAEALRGTADDAIAEFMISEM